MTLFVKQVEYGRKLLVLGVLLFADPGSISQMYLALVISFTVVLITTRYMPFKNATTDAYKVAMVTGPPIPREFAILSSVTIGARFQDVNLFFTFSCALLLKLNLAGEFLPPGFYDVTMTASNLLIGLVPALWSVWHTISMLRRNTVEMTEHLIEANTLAKPGEPKLTRYQMLRKLLAANEKDLKRLFKDLRTIVGVEDSDDEEEEEDDSEEAEEDAEADDGEDQEQEQLEDQDDEDVELGTMALQLAIDELRPKVEPLLAKILLTWEDVLPALELIDTLEEIQEAIADPEAFLTNLASAAGPVAIRFAITKLRPVIEPLLARKNLMWEDFRAAAEAVNSLEQLQDALSSPADFVEGMHVHAARGH